MKQCPACLPPDNQGCATCSGVWSVTQEVFDNFIEMQNIKNQAVELKQQVNEVFNTTNSVDEIKSELLNLIS
jgi:hypothetical protein